MLKAEIKKEVMITNREIAQLLLKDGSFMEQIEETLDEMLYEKYRMDYDSRRDAISGLTNADYIQIFASLATEIGKTERERMAQNVSS